MARTCFLLILPKHKIRICCYIGAWRSLASARDWGSRGRRFKSCRPDFSGKPKNSPENDASPFCSERHLLKSYLTKQQGNAGNCKGGADNIYNSAV